MNELALVSGDFDHLFILLGESSRLRSRLKLAVVCFVLLAFWMPFPVVVWMST